jgi:hypothetical protein
MAALANGDAVGVTKLLHAGAYVDAADPKGETPLLAAVRRGDPALVALLLNHGASVTETDNVGRSPLMLAKQARRWDLIDMLEPQVAFANAYHRLPMEPGRFWLDYGILERARSGALVYTRWGMPVAQAVRAARVLGGPGIDYVNPEQDGTTLYFKALSTDASPEVTLQTRGGIGYRITVTPR